MSYQSLKSCKASPTVEIKAHKLNVCGSLFDISNFNLPLLGVWSRLKNRLTSSCPIYCYNLKLCLTVDLLWAIDAKIISLRNNVRT